MKKKKNINATTLIKMMSRNKFKEMPKSQVIPNKKKKNPKYSNKDKEDH